MPKMKTHSGLKKRVKLTKNGKVKRTCSNTLHNAGSKSNKQKKRLHKGTYADAANVKTIKKMLPYS